MTQSIIKGFMILHSDGDYEYYSPELSDDDLVEIYKILDKYGDNNPSIRGEIAENCHKTMNLLSE